MRKILFTLCLLITTLAAQAAPINGISVESRRTSFVVFIDGQQMCTPTLNCFIANLKAGTYLIEAYEAKNCRESDRYQRRQPLLSQRVYTNGIDIKELYIPERSIIDTNNKDDYYDRPSYQTRVMDSRSFNDFYNRFKKEPFDDDRLKMLDTALSSCDFLCEQCLRLISLYTFDDDKLKIVKRMYYRIVDKENTYQLIDAMTFSSSKDEIKTLSNSCSNKRR